MADDDFEFEPEEAAPKTARGVVVNKSRLSEFTGLSPMTIDKLLADGGPIISKGTRKQGWQINTADFFGWFWRRKVEEVTDDPEAGSFERAKRLNQESQTRLRDLTIAKMEGELVPIVDVEKWATEMYGLVRSRFLAVESQISGLTDDQKDTLRAAIADALADVSGYRDEGVADVAN